jgi:Mn-dependent DtxR family transcriptional regulator
MLKGGNSMALQESGEMYLETIHVLSKESTGVRSVDIGAHMGYSKPSVSRAVGLLKSGGFINVDKDGYITLTDSGKEIAEKIYDRHTTLTKLLMLLGVDKQTATEDACKLEHNLSDESFAAIKAHLLKYEETNK